MDYPNLYKYLLGQASEQETEELFRWVDADASRRTVFIEIKRIWALNAEDSYKYEVAWTQVQERIKGFRRRKRIGSVLKYAAVLVIGLMAAGYFWNGTHLPKEEITGDQITLRLGNGEIKILNEDPNQDIRNNDGEIIAEKNREGLTYVPEGKTVKSGQIEFNQLWVPYGKTFRLMLSDGTKVLINSGTSIKYPKKFPDVGERVVHLSGEAFFEVSKDAEHPFIVDTDAMDVRVLGTKFNVSSYPEDHNVTAVLVEGSVNVFKDDAADRSQNFKHLDPGEKAELNPDTKNITVEKVDISLYTAWTKGRIVFRDTPFSEIRKKLERRYNVRIINKNKELDRRTYNASFDEENIVQVLKTLNESYAIHYTMNNREITIE